MVALCHKVPQISAGQIEFRKLLLSADTYVVCPAAIFVVLGSAPYSLTRDYSQLHLNITIPQVYNYYKSQLDDPLLSKKPIYCFPPIQLKNPLNCLPLPDETKFALQQSGNPLNSSSKPLLTLTFILEQRDLIHLYTPPMPHQLDRQRPIDFPADHTALQFKEEHT